MVKFLKKFSEMVGNQIEATKVTTKFMAMGGTQLTLQKFFDIYFKAIEGYASGNPSGADKWAWKIYICKVVDKKSTCDDKDFVGMKIKDRCKLIQKENPLTPQSLKWIKEELKPYFEESYKDQMKAVEVIINDIDLLAVKKDVGEAKKYLGA